ncbi:flavodoxin domain-containing protein [Aquibacillus koreensis]|uniref:Flavodoxin domain-containing protein n=1 Tax=Aquibacillus koreensis TaxID=279446 RepID=A0A9X4AIH6_9BACI|nr:flavodoxin domain-containing protein [Aquibacillus koreensis]MCT2537805.1 flavodoxin domain-containing protein [Aquibacillus koreensis]MDC3421162.1 flavodoxin domain-containing protein [Aquibacillus koreensis]
MKTVILYTTKYGAVEQSAFKLKELLPEPTILFNLNKEYPTSLEEYDRVIIGGSIYMGQIQRKLIQYINEHLSTLLSKQVGMFICAGHPDADVVASELQGAFPLALYNHAKVKDSFGHIYDFEKLNFIDTFITKKIVGISKSETKLLDDKINSFVTSLVG